MDDFSLVRKIIADLSGVHGKARELSEGRDPSPLLISLTALARLNMRLKNAGVPPGQLEPLVALATALHELEGGGAPSMLARATPGHRPNASPLRLEFQTRAALALDVLMNAGLQLNDAAARVALRFSQGRDQNDPMFRISARSVVEWRSLATGNGADRPRREELDRLRAALENMGFQQPYSAIAAEAAVNKLAEFSENPLITPS